MEGGGNEDSISTLTYGTYNERKNEIRHNVWNENKAIYYIKDTIEAGKLVVTEGGLRNVARPMNAPCDPDPKRLYEGRERLFIKGPDETPLVEHCLYNAFLFGISNTPNLVGADAQGNKIYEKIATKHVHSDIPRISAKVLKALFNMCDRDNEGNIFINKNNKLINLDTENIGGKFIFENSSFNNTFNKFKEMLQGIQDPTAKVAFKKQLDSILGEEGEYKKYEYNAFLGRYISTCNKCYISMEKARHELHAFVKRAKKYKEMLIKRLTEEIKNLEKTGPQNTQNEFVKGVFKQILEYSEQDLKNFNDFLKQHNSFKEQLGKYKRPSFCQRVYNFIFGNFDVEPVRPSKYLIKCNTKNINQQVSNGKI